MHEETIPHSRDPNKRETRGDGKNTRPLPVSRDRIEIGRRIVLACRTKGFEKQADIAKALKISQMTVSYWIRGLKAPPISQGLKLAKVLGVCVEWLYTGRGQMTPEVPEESVQIAEKITHSPPHLRQLIDSVINSIEEWSERERHNMK